MCAPSKLNRFSKREESLPIAICAYGVRRDVDFAKYQFPGSVKNRPKKKEFKSSIIMTKIHYVLFIMLEKTLLRNGNHYILLIHAQNLQT